MKNKILLAVIMLFFVGICCIPMKSYAAICDSIGHNYVGRTCTSPGTCTRCNATQAAKGHSYGGYSVTSWETCTSDGYEVAYCSCGASTGRSRGALGHDMGSWKDNGESNHRRDCDRSGCSHYETEAHGGGTWYHEDGLLHFKDCSTSTCGHKKYTSGTHNKGTTEAYGNDDKHHMKCTDCAYVWPSSEDEKHNWAHQEGDHTCSDCGEVVDGEHHYYIIDGEAKVSYDCKYKDNGNPCTYSVVLAPAPFSGTPISEYFC